MKLTIAQAALLTLAIPLAAAPALAQTLAAKKPTVPIPPLTTARPVVLPPVVQKTLSNGIKLVLLEDHKQPALWIRLALPVGTVRDPQSKVGLVEMTAAMLDKGTTMRTESQIADTIDGLGASLSAGASADYLTVAASGLSNYTDTLFDLVADITLNPVFPQVEIDRYKTRTLNTIQQSLSDPTTLANAALNRAVYGSHPYGNYAVGLPATLPTITGDDLKSFHDTYFAPNGATLFLVGDITPEQAVAKAEKAFSGWKPKVVAPAAYPAPPAATGNTPHITIIDRPTAEQSVIVIGTLASRYSDPTRLAGRLAAVVLGEGQFEGRLMQEIRVKRGLTYGAQSGFARRKEAGLFEIGTFTKPASTGQVVQLALAEAKKLATIPPGAAELNDRKTYLKGNFAVEVATPDGVLAALIPAILYGSGTSEVTEYIPRISALTGAQVESAIRALPLNRAQIVLVGNAKAIQPQLAKIGTVTVIPESDVDLNSPDLRQAAAPAKPAAPVSAADQAEGKARLDATIKAHGGDAFLNLKTLKITGKGELTPGPGTGAPDGFKVAISSLTLYSVSPDKSRLNLKSDYGDIISVAMGGTLGGYQSTPLGSKTTPPKDTFSSDPTALLRAAALKNYPVAAIEAVDKNNKPILSADNKPLKGFAITDPSGTVVRFYAEADTGIVRRVVTPTPAGDGAILLSAYKTTDGVVLPGTILIQNNGVDFLNLTLETVEINKPIDDALFAAPKAAP